MPICEHFLQPSINDICDELLACNFVVLSVATRAKEVINCLPAMNVFIFKTFVMSE